MDKRYLITEIREARDNEFIMFYLLIIEVDIKSFFRFCQLKLNFTNRQVFFGKYPSKELNIHDYKKN